MQPGDNSTTGGLEPEVAQRWSCPRPVGLTRGVDLVPNVKPLGNISNSERGEGDAYHIAKLLTPLEETGKMHVPFSREWSVRPRGPCPAGLGPA